MKKKIPPAKKSFLFLVLKSCFWFCAGAVLGLFFFISFTFILFQNIYHNSVYPGVIINGIDFGGKSQAEVEKYFSDKNIRIQNTLFTLKKDDQIATISAKQLHMGYDAQLLAKQAYSIGRSNSFIADISLITQAYINGIRLRPSYTYREKELLSQLDPIIQANKVDPVDALFTFENNRVTAFKPSSDGQAVDVFAIKTHIENMIPSIVTAGKTQTIVMQIPIQIIKPKVATDDVNHLGIHELIGTGTSLFYHSIPSRIYNITLAASRINGVLVAPGEEFSFDQALGDVSKFTGYKEAYVIQNGKTVLGDGGGVCQVSTTFFRALLNAGLPITERLGHAYRVGYYEEDSPPGIDATVFVPSVDLKFKNDTGHHILIQSTIDSNELRLTIQLYGTKDGRTVTMTKPVVTNETPPPPPLYQDDPTLPKGTIKQVDFAAAGAHVSFTRQVIKNNKLAINDIFITDFQPWQAAYQRGTKE